MFCGEGFQLATLSAVVLDEDQIPDFHHPRIARIHQSAPRTVRRQIDMDLGARTAGSGVAHLPEIVFLAEPEDMGGIDVRLLAPEGLGFAVGLEYRGIQPCLVESPHAGEQLPGPPDRLFLVVVAERPVAQHLKKGVVIGVASHFLEVVVLAADADAFLRVRGADVFAGSRAEEDILELIHPRIGEVEGGVAMGNHRCAGHNPVSVHGKEVKEPLAYFVGFHQTSICVISWISSSMPLTCIQRLISPA